MPARESLRNPLTGNTVSMKNSTFLTSCLVHGFLAVVLQDHVTAQEDGAKTAKADNTAAERAIRASVDTFAKAYNSHDAKAVADLFLPEAQIVDEADNTIQGRESIQHLFTEVFAEQPDTGIAIEIESIRFIGTSLAVETGSTTTVPPAGQEIESGRYSVLHILQDGKWSMGLVRDIPAEPSHRDHLEALAWLVGDWVDESVDGRVHTSCQWADNDSFLLQEVTVRRADQEVIKVSQRIGWDPLRKQFKAWTFDSEGGYGESQWTPTETGWLIKATSVNSDGSTASATNHVEPIGMDRYVFQSVDRVSGNELLPAVKVIVVRQPPQPQELESTPVPAK
jgi:uncharacterized protein (TIGR02246 family)